MNERSSLGSMFVRTPYYVLTGGLVIIFLFPLVWAVVSSFSAQAGSAQALGYGFGNYERLFNFQEGLPRYFMNSVVIAALTVFFTVSVSTLGGYAFARFSFPGKNILFLIVLAILMVPYATLLIPLFVLLRQLELDNTLVGLSLVLAVYQLPFATFMMRVSFEAVPTELEEAALVDGANRRQIVWHILTPLLMPAVATAGIISLILSWNEFLLALSLTRAAAKTSPVGVQEFTGLYGTQWGNLTAASCMIAAPIVVCVLVLRRRVVSGLAFGAVK